MYNHYSIFKLWTIAPYHTYQRKKKLIATISVVRRGEYPALSCAALGSIQRLSEPFTFRGQQEDWYSDLEFFFLTSLICTVQLHSQSSSSLGRHGFPSKTERFSSTVPTSQLSLSMAQGVKFATRLSKLNHLLWQEFSISLKGFSPDACRGTFIKTL